MPATAAPRVSAFASFPTLEEIKLALGIASDDASKDAALTAMLASTLAMIEGYLQRGIVFAHELEEFDSPESRVDVLLLFRFPVSEVQAITQEGAALTGYRVSKKSGVVRWRDACRVRCCESLPVVVEYDGGYPDDAWPADLLDAVMRAFYARWNATDGSGNTAMLEGGPANRSVTIDGLTITRDSASYAGTALGEQVIPPELAQVAAQLDRYRARPVGGI